MLDNYRKVILDASAFIALASEEKGWEMVASILPKAVMSAVNVAEVAKFMIELKGSNKEEAQSVINQSISEIYNFSEEQAFISADLIKVTKRLGLSLGDRACIALAIDIGYPILTADKAWDKLKMNDVTIKQIR